AANGEADAGERMNRPERQRDVAQSNDRLYRSASVHVSLPTGAEDAERASAGSKSAEVPADGNENRVGRPCASALEWRESTRRRTPSCASKSWAAADGIASPSTNATATLRKPSTRRSGR